MLNLIQPLIDKIKDIVLDKLKNLNLDNDGVLDHVQIAGFVERAAAIAKKLAVAIHAPTLEEAIEHGKVMVEALKRAVDADVLKEAVGEGKQLAKEVGAYINAVVKELSKGAK